MTAPVPLLLSDGAPVGIVRQAMLALMRIDRTLADAEGGRRPHHDRLHRLCGHREAEWTSPDGSRIRAWTEPHAFDAKVVEDGLVLRIADVADPGVDAVVVMAPRRDSPPFDADGGTEALRATLAPVLASARAASAIGPDRWTPAAREGDALLTRDLDEATEAGVEMLGGMIALLCDRMPGMGLGLVTGDPHGAVRLLHLDGPAEADAGIAAARCSPLIPPQTALRLRTFDGCTSYEFGPRVIRTRRVDCRLSPVDAMRIARECGIEPELVA